MVNGQQSPPRPQSKRVTLRSIIIAAACYAPYHNSIFIFVGYTVGVEKRRRALLTSYQACGRRISVSEGFTQPLAGTGGAAERWPAIL
jgi:hypothetical protein